MQVDQVQDVLGWKVDQERKLELYARQLQHMGN